MYAVACDRPAKLVDVPVSVFVGPPVRTAWYCVGEPIGVDHVMSCEDDVETLHETVGMPGGDGDDVEQEMDGDGSPVQVSMWNLGPPWTRHASTMRDMATARRRRRSGVQLSNASYCP